MFMEVKMLRQEVQMLQQQMNTYAPLADMVPNFASEWLGMPLPIPILILIAIPCCLGFPAPSLLIFCLCRCQNHPRIIFGDIPTYRKQRDTKWNHFIFVFIQPEASRDPGEKILTFDHQQHEPKVSNMDIVNFSQEQTPLHPGNCWCFSGGEGHLVISLAQPAAVSHVTLGHISKSQSPTGNTSSAPRKFSVYVRKTDSKLSLWGDLWT